MPEKTFHVEDIIHVMETYIKSIRGKWNGMQKRDIEASHTYNAAE